MPLLLRQACALKAVLSKLEALVSVRSAAASGGGSARGWAVVHGVRPQLYTMQSVWDQFAAALEIVERHPTLGPFARKVIEEAELFREISRTSSWCSFILEATISSCALGLFGLVMNICLIADDVVDVSSYFLWVFVFFVSHFLAELLFIPCTNISRTHKRLFIVVLGVALGIILILVIAVHSANRTQAHQQTTQYIWEVPASSKTTFTPPGTWEIERTFPDGQHTVQSFVPHLQCGASLTQVILAIQYRCGKMSIHGLWYSPQGACTNCPLSSRPQNGEPFHDFSMSLLEKAGLIPSLERDWPSCVPQNSNEQFWRHEWEKHGTCTGLSVEVYFAVTQSLFEAYAHLCQQRFPSRGNSPTPDCKLCFTPSRNFSQPPTFC